LASESFTSGQLFPESISIFYCSSQNVASTSDTSPQRWSNYWELGKSAVGCIHFCPPIPLWVHMVPGPLDLWEFLVCPHLILVLCQFQLASFSSGL
jgi:hypothetical protein